MDEYGFNYIAIPPRYASYSVHRVHPGLSMKTHVVLYNLFKPAASPWRPAFLVIKPSRWLLKIRAACNDQTILHNFSDALGIPRQLRMQTNAIFAWPLRGIEHACTTTRGCAVLWNRNGMTLSTGDTPGSFYRRRKRRTWISAP